MMNKIRIKKLGSRPRFKVYTKASKSELIEIIKHQLELRKKDIGGYANQEFAMIRLRKDKNKYWAPQLQIRWETDEENDANTIVRGVIGPKSNIWTLFMFVYGLCGAVIITIGSYSISEYIVKGYSNWLWVVLVALIIMLSAFIASKIGQIISKEHLDEINIIVDEIFEKTEFYE